uniref:Uncharacterized protein n=1 Tax=Oryza meridionalis TaxID=40149 RepID=A0A0E0EDC4_9ORYZ
MERRRPHRIDVVSQVVTSIVSAASLPFPVAADAYLSPSPSLPPLSLSLRSMAAARAMRRANAAAGATLLLVTDNT